MATTTTTKANAVAARRLRRIKQAQRASILLKQASDVTRLRVLLELEPGEMCVGALATFLGQSQPAVSHHLALLRHSGLIAPRRQGKNNFYGLTAEGRRLAAVARALIDGGGCRSEEP